MPCYDGGEFEMRFASAPDPTRQCCLGIGFVTQGPFLNVSVKRMKARPSRREIRAVYYRCCNCYIQRSAISDVQQADCASARCYGDGSRTSGD